MFAALLLALLPAASVQGTVRAEGTGDVVAHAVVAMPELRQTVRVDAQGRFTLTEVPAGRWRMEVTALGFRPYTASIDVPADGTVRHDVRLRSSAVALAAVRVAGQSTGRGGPDVERALFDRVVQPGAVGISQQEIRDLPAVGEPDVFRALQALPGVSTGNDLNGQVHVRGGGPDQNAFLLDGARIFAPYHLFGVAAAFNPDAVARVEFFRGGIPARYGGAISSVIEVAQRTGADEPYGAEAGVSLLGARLTAHGQLQNGGGGWMIAGRRTHADLVAPTLSTGRFPYAFHDVQGRLSLAPAGDQRLDVSFFNSWDRFDVFGEGNDDLRSTWANLAGSVRWARHTGEGTWRPSVLAWGTRYDGQLAGGPDRSGEAAAEPNAVDNRITSTGVRAQATRAMRGMELTLGAEVEATVSELAGPERPGGYVEGGVEGSAVSPAMFAELDLTRGRLRIAPGVRVMMDSRDDSVVAEARLAVRYNLTPDVALSLSADRSHQVVSMLRDDRQTIPGAPLLFLHPAGAPRSRSDALTASIEGWRGREFSFGASVYGRGLRGVPRWMPEGAREFEQLEWDDGSAVGAELMARRHTGRVTGWVAYSLGRTTLEGENGREYQPSWDRTHSLDLAAFFRPWGSLVLSAQVEASTGAPFWPVAGALSTTRLDPNTGGVAEVGIVPIWSNVQQRQPAYFRLDLSARQTFGFRGVDIEPNIAVRNATNRRNVLYYELSQEIMGDPMDPTAPRAPVLRPVSLPLVPSIGIDVRF